MMINYFWIRETKYQSMSSNVVINNLLRLRIEIQYNNYLLNFNRIL